MGWNSLAPDAVTKGAKATVATHQSPTRARRFRCRRVLHRRRGRGAGFRVAAARDRSCHRARARRATARGTGGARHALGGRAAASPRDLRFVRTRRCWAPNAGASGPGRLRGLGGVAAGRHQLPLSRPGGAPPLDPGRPLLGRERSGEALARVRAQDEPHDSHRRGSGRRIDPRPARGRGMGRGCRLLGRRARRDVCREALCVVQGSWDGGDGSDSTYMPEPGESIELLCVPRVPGRAPKR